MPPVVDEAMDRLELDKSLLGISRWLCMLGLFCREDDEFDELPFDWFGWLCSLSVDVAALVVVLIVAICEDGITKGTIVSDQSKAPNVK